MRRQEPVMTRILGVWSILLASGVALAGQTAAPISATTFAIPTQPSTPPPGWILHAADGSTAVSSATVRAYGPGVRITTSTPVTLYPLAATLSDDGTVGAVFFVDSDTPAAFGVTLGGDDGVAFVVQPAGAVGIAPLSGGQLDSVTWTPAAAVSIPARGLLQPCRVEVRVSGTNAELLLDGKVAASTTIAVGTLHGAPGVYSGPGALAVAGLMVRSAAPVPPPSK
jgi:hypothetical protein